MVIGTAQLSKIKASDARAALGLSQRDLAALAGVSTQAVVNSEHSRPIRRLSAHAILRAINEKRAESSLPPLSMENMDWKIQGE